MQRALMPKPVTTQKAKEDTKEKPKHEEKKEKPKHEEEKEKPKKEEDKAKPMKASRDTPIEGKKTAPESVREDLITPSRE